MKRFTLRNEILLQLVESAQDGIVVAEKEGDDTDQSAVGVIRKAIEDEAAVRTILKNYR